MALQRMHMVLFYKQYAGVQWRIQPGAGGMPPPVGGLAISFRQYINIITKPTAYDGPRE